MTATKPQSTTDALPPEDMTDDELKAAISFHERQAMRFKSEGAKLWRLRLRIGKGEPIDRKMLAELQERRASRISPASAAPVVDNEQTEGPRNWLHEGICIAYANAMRQACVRELYVMKAEHKAAGTYPQGVGTFDEIAKRLGSLVLPAAATAAPQRLFEAKLLGFGEGDRIRLCEPCLRRAIDDHLVSFAAALPAAPTARSNREPHAFQEHPLYPNYCAFAVGDEDYCKRETDNVIHQVTTAAPVEQSDESRYVVIDGERRRVIPCPDGKPDCEVLHTEPVSNEGAR